MSKGAVSFNESNVEYYTPKNIVDLFGSFDYDPATTAEQAEYLGIPNYDTIETDGLFADWTQYRKIWINPPFSQKHLFFDKAVRTYKIARNDIFFLCPIEFLTTRRLHDCLQKWGGVKIKIFLPAGRIKFKSGIGANEKSPAFGSVVLKLQDEYELEIIRI